MGTDITQDSLRPLLPARPHDGHKGTFGHVFILAGSRGFTGAAKLAAEAAGRSGAGLVTVGIPRSLADIVASLLWEAMSLPLPATEAETFSADAVDPALEAASHRTSVVLGPGISRHEETRAFVHGFVARCPVPMVIDADGLNCLGSMPFLLTAVKAPTVVTPHPGEMARLAGCSTGQVQENREETAKRFAVHFGCTVILKGYRTVVAAADGKAYINTTGNSGLATGGTGDVLSGLVGGLLAQGMAAVDAARLGVYLHGLAGDLAAHTHTKRGMIARDVIEAIPSAWCDLEGAD